MKVLSSRSLVFHRFLDVFFPAKWREFVSRLQFHEKRKPNEKKIENSATRSLERRLRSLKFGPCNPLSSVLSFPFKFFTIQFLTICRLIFHTNNTMSVAFHPSR